MGFLERFRYPASSQTSGRAATEADISLAYRLVLGRDPDPDGLAHYRDRLRDGLSLEALLSSLLQSDEYRSPAPVATHSAHRTPTPHASRRPATAIDPADVIRRCSVEELARTADEYYRRVDDATPLMAKPFAFLHETPEMLQNLGLLLGKLHLGKSMTVLDFGAGTCWLSRLLSQLNCRLICCDTSDAALDIGRRLYEQHPPIGSRIAPVFLRFDGHRLDLADASVDRIICFDAFHHVPNQAEVLAEFARVLRPGGLAAFSEPGPYHSLSPQAQYEMRDHQVLENDIDLPAIFALARTAGFTAIEIVLAASTTIGLDDYRSVLAGSASPAIDTLAAEARRTASDKSIFVLSKGPLRPDSRSHLGLAHHMTLDAEERAIADDNTVTVRCRIHNAGTARWLHVNAEIYGTVRLGAHLYDETDTLLEVDHFRAPLPRDVEPGETIDMVARIPVPGPGAYRLTLDLVAEGVSWFENLGSAPCRVTARG